MKNKEVESLVKSTMQKNQVLVLVRGCPGSGKSTIAKEVAEEFGFAHFENDMFFMKNGKYCFDDKKVKDAANWCYHNIEKALFDGKNAVVANVFVTNSSVNRYRDLAAQCGAEFIVFRSNASFGDVHSVPRPVYNSMKAHFSDYPNEITLSMSAD